MLLVLISACLLSFLVILFSLLQYNRRNSGQARLLILTSNAIYNFLPVKFQLRRRIDIRDLTSITLSRLCTDLIVLHHRYEHDYLLTSPKRAELIYHLQHAYHRLTAGRRTIEYEFSERLYVRDKNDMIRDVQILDSQSFKLGKPFHAQGVNTR